LNDKIINFQGCHVLKKGSGAIYCLTHEPLSATCNTVKFEGVVPTSAEHQFVLLIALCLVAAWSVIFVLNLVLLFN